MRRIILILWSVGFNSVLQAQPARILMLTYHALLTKYVPCLLAQLIRADENLTRSFSSAPGSFTGLAEKNTGDVLGDYDFFLSSIGCTRGGNDPEACITETVVEQQLVEVDNTFGPFARCRLHNYATYECQHNTTRVGKEDRGGSNGCWYSFPAVGEGRYWASLGLPSRISSAS